ncbi:MAG TPA: cysteine--tRNA ligase [Dongiaceae bacterium]|nr:cysteine--tRNA ligase [Dongiaceae bacterium]
MPLRLYDSLTREKSAFVPLDPGNVRLYVCGPTVYDYAHIGNARPVVVFDVLFRLLRARYGAAHVTYVSNFTDIDDKIIAAAAANGEEIGALTERTAAAYREDMAALGALEPTHRPLATHHVGAMIGMIERLIETGHAYAAENHVLFQIDSFARYGALSRRSLEDMIAGARVEVAPYKKNPADFVLWKPSDPSQPGWDSPWGRGRPGWHIECSAMAEHLLGQTFDIHGGGIDLLFPHHENEIAQSCAAHEGAPLARYWMHNGHVQVNGTKMAKSLGNFLTVHGLLAEGCRGEAIRLALLSAHYRQPLDIGRDLIQECKAQLDRFYQALDRAPPAAPIPAPDVEAALADDLNTPQALAALHTYLGRLNRAENPQEQIAAKGLLLGGASLLGLLDADPSDWLRSGQGGVSEADICEAIEARVAARQAKNFTEADAIRAALLAQGIMLEDGPLGTTWKRV